MPEPAQGRIMCKIESDTPLLYHHTTHVWYPKCLYLDGINTARNTSIDDVAVRWRMSITTFVLRTLTSLPDKLATHFDGSICSRFTRIHSLHYVMSETKQKTKYFCHGIEKKTLKTRVFTFLLLSYPVWFCTFSTKTEVKVFPSFSFTVSLSKLTANKFEPFYNISDNMFCYVMAKCYLQFRSYDYHPNNEFETGLVFNI